MPNTANTLDTSDFHARLLMNTPGQLKAVIVVKTATGSQHVIALVSACAHAFPGTSDSYTSIHDTHTSNMPQAPVPLYIHDVQKNQGVRDSYSSFDL